MDAQADHDMTPHPEAGFDFLPLTADDSVACCCDNEPACVWMDDCEVQENLFQILPLTPEESCVDADNHIYSTGGFTIFFEELGYLTEEPQPIDPSRDYDREAKALLEERSRTRQKHIELSVTPSLDESNSGLSSAASSFHYTDYCDTANDSRSPPPNLCYKHPHPQAYTHSLGDQTLLHHNHHNHHPYHTSPLRTPYHLPS